MASRRMQSAAGGGTWLGWISHQNCEYDGPQAILPNPTRICSLNGASEEQGEGGLVMP